jgi:DNA-binding XRE family transcriptional regulator
MKEHPVTTARHRAGMTQQELAHRAGLAIRTMSNVESGQSPRFATKRVIAHVLGTHVDALWPPLDGSGSARRAA